MAKSRSSTGEGGASSVGTDRREPLNTRRARLLAVLAGATLVSLFFVFQNLVRALVYGQPIRLAWSLGSELLYWYLLAAALPLVLWLARRFRIERDTWTRTVPVHVALALLVGLVHSGVYYTALAAISNLVDGPGGVSAAIGRVAGIDWTAVGRRLPDATLTVVWKYGVAVGLFYAYDYYRKYQERKLQAAHLERRLSEARLQALRMQLHPHFLFNTLHTASMLAERDPEATSRVLARLADLLRATLDEGGSPEVPLATELSFVRRYLEIEQVRFGERLSVEWEVPDELLDVRVPTLIIQPLVENAVRHGVSRRPGARHVRIDIRRDHEMLIVDVSDDGPGLPESWSLDRDAGVGLSNTRDRLNALYGPAGTLEVVGPPGGGVRAAVRMPLRRTGKS